MAANRSDGTSIGFLHEVDESSELEAIFFPSKVGGKPAWLAQDNIPSLKELSCSNCGKLMVFLLQVYAPVDENALCFHRTIYIFVCCNSKCCEKNSNIPFKAFRNQLPRENKFFDFEAVSSEATSDEIKSAVEELRLKWGTVCNLCGYRADKKCSACKGAHYCSKEHQTLDWKTSHKYSCSGSKCRNEGLVMERKHAFVLPEFELESEPEAESHTSETGDASVVETSVHSPAKEAELDHDNDGAFAKIADKQFQKFKTIVSKMPGQVLRYAYNGMPLWVSDEHQAEPSDIPDCSCGANRIYEFQVLPQLLNYLGMDSLHDKSVDFGTLAVYTCSENCPSSSKYSPEFVWKQDYADVDVKYQ